MAWLQRTLQRPDGTGLINFYGGPSGRMPASTVNELSSGGSTKLTVSAAGEPIRLAYGWVPVWGRIYAVGFHSGALVYGIKWCMGEIDAIVDVIIDDAAPAAGVTMEHYLGTTTQIVSPTLQAALAGYTDDLIYTTPTGHQFGIAHSVIRIPTSAMSAPPQQFRAIIRGRKCVDPRTGLRVYTESPALHLYDMLTAPEIGMRVPVLGGEALADFNDTIMADGAPRNRCGIVFEEPAEGMAQAALLAEYADCIFPVWEGDALRLVPDAPASEPLPVVDVDEIILDSYEMSMSGLMQAPNSVTVYYTVPMSGTQAWPEEPMPALQPEVRDGKVLPRPSNVKLPGIQRGGQAYRMALARLARARNGGQIGLGLVDTGLRLQPGDVVLARCPRAGLSLPVRITGHAMPRLDRYQIRARPYLLNEYPDPASAPGGEGGVPVGVIGFLLGAGAVPDGWEQVSEANGRLLRGAANDGEIGSTGGSNEITIAGTTGAISNHTGTGQRASWNGTDGGSNPYIATTNDPTVPHGAHAHTYSRSVTVNPLRLMTRLVQKTGSGAPYLPAAIATLAGQQMPYQDVAMVTSDIAGRLLGAAAVLAAEGVASQAVSLTYSAVGSHAHHTEQRLDGSEATDPTRLAYEYVEAGAHDHAGSPGVAITPNPRRRRMHLYRGLADRKVRPGDVFGWSGSLSSLPAGFVLCDGSNDTLDLRGFFIELTAGAAGAALGDNTLAWSGETSVDHHNHAGSRTPQYSKGVHQVLHGDNEVHAHSVTGSVSYVPPFYRLALIQFNGGA